MKIDLNSPVEVWRIDAPNTGFPSCELTLFNLSGQQVVSVEVTLTLLDPDGQEITRITHRAHGLTGAPHAYILYDRAGGRARERRRLRSDYREGLVR